MSQKNQFLHQYFPMKKNTNFAIVTLALPQPEATIGPPA